ncbi:DUF7448 domain-containing protein [Paenibacillus cymbidii]|uniref:DUF7448 domain-containing protein n=1 Tax=Paenibacillus cymbidii TaxID=1639034 RepID=UPI001081B8C6|nr:hypothetical protein [Paenibacillus cymbidii]
METILRIEQINESGRFTGMSGYAVATDKQTIKMLIDNGQSCCENWGYFMSEDNLDNFIGAKLLDIGITDTALNSQMMVSENLSGEPPYVYEGGVMFVNLTTDHGVLQFVAYNEHNGYYGHDAKLISEQLTHEECL